jgi:hypothetical protein
MINDDLLLACTDLVGRAGAIDMEIGHSFEPDPETGEHVWWAAAKYRGMRVIANGMPAPDIAAVALCHKLLRGAICKCGKPVALGDGQDGCHWTLNGKRWDSSCTAPSLKVDNARRGDLSEVHRLLSQRQAEREPS